MSEQADKQETVELGQVNEDLTRGLKSCHSLVDDYRLKLAANSNESDAANESELTDEQLG